MENFANNLNLLPSLIEGDRFAVLHNGFIRWATVAKIDDTINISPDQQEYFTIIFIKDKQTK